MSSFPILDLVIGVIFIFFLLSIICGSAVEIFFSILRTRARILGEWLLRVFDQPALAPDGKPLGKSLGAAIVDHCMITALSKTGKSNSYIDSENFVTALLDKITIAEAKAPSSGSNSAAQIPPATLPEYISAIQQSTVISGELKRTILAFANEAQQAAGALSKVPGSVSLGMDAVTAIKSELDHFRERLAKWYDTNADRLTGTLKRKSLLITFIVGTIVTVSLNVDTVAICKYLYNNKAASKQLAEQAMSTYKKYNEAVDSVVKRNGVTSADEKTYDKYARLLKKDIDSLSALDLPIGWNCKVATDTSVHANRDLTACVRKVDGQRIFGWLFTILAICLGAPFWFDILNKIANLRSSGPKPNSSSDSLPKPKS